MCDDMVRFCSRDMDLVMEAGNYRTFWICVHMGLEGRRRSLCQGENVERVIIASLKCHHLHHDQSQLRLAPVKFEQVVVVVVLGPGMRLYIMRELICYTYGKTINC